MKEILSAILGSDETMDIGRGYAHPHLKIQLFPFVQEYNEACDVSVG